MSETTPPTIAPERAPSRPPAPKKHASLAGMDPAPDIESYDAVPWFRKTWPVLFPLFAPVAIVVALTGDVYAKANSKMKDYSDAEVWRYNARSRAFFVVAALSSVVFYTIVAVWLFG